MQLRDEIPGKIKMNINMLRKYKQMDKNELVWFNLRFGCINSKMLFKMEAMLKK